MILFFSQKQRPTGWGRGAAARLRPVWESHCSLGLHTTTAAAAATTNGGDGDGDSGDGAAAFASQHGDGIVPLSHHVDGAIVPVTPMREISEEEIRALEIRAAKYLSPRWRRSVSAVAVQCRRACVAVSSARAAGHFST